MNNSGVLNRLSAASQELRASEPPDLDFVIECLTWALNQVKAEREKTLEPTNPSSQ